MFRIEIIGKNISGEKYGAEKSKLFKFINNFLLIIQFLYAANTYSRTFLLLQQAMRFNTMSFSITIPSLYLYCM